MKSDYKRHKSTFFSVDVRNLDLTYDEQKIKQQMESDEPNVKNADTIRRNMKLDITNAVRDIAKNVAPAHTQLFEVFFDGK